jgi:hypothetical protein
MFRCQRWYENPTLASIHTSPNLSSVLYYSNDILAKALPDLGPYISLGITIVNVMMTFPPIFLIEVRCCFSQAHASSLSDN